MKKLLILLAVPLFYLAIFLTRFSYYVDRYKEVHAYNYLTAQADIIMQLIVFCIFYFVLFPLFLSRRRFLAFAIYGLVTILVSSVMVFLYHLLFISVGELKGMYFSPYDKMVPVRAFFSGVGACFVRGFVSWLSDARYKKLLERRNLEVELALLKAQINPHFLFNTLNNIDVLIEKDPQKASAYLNKLSSILRFMLYDGPAEKIELTQEIKYIEEYLELQKIRTVNPDFIHFDIKGDLENIQIAPMLFIPLIENAFKHATNKKVNNAIEISFTVEGNTLNFLCSNVFEPAAIVSSSSSGLGMGLIRNRLDILYKGAYKLNIEQTNQRFIVTLTLNNLNDH